MNHNAQVQRFGGMYHLICNICGELAVQPANRGGLLARAERHNNGRPGRKAEARLMRHRNMELRDVVRMVEAPAPIAAPASPVRRIEEADCTTGEIWYKYVHQMGFKMLGQGASRRVYDLGDGRVVKIHSPRDGAAEARWGDQCAKEVRRWDSSSDAQRAHMATILSSGFHYVIMEKAIATLYALNGGNHYDAVTSDLSDTTGFNDMHAANIGYFPGGKFKVIDYAL